MTPCFALHDRVMRSMISGVVQVRHRCARYQSDNTAIHWLTGYCAVLSQEAQSKAEASCRELGINVKTVTKWRKCETVGDRQTGPTGSSSTVSSADEDAMNVVFRRHTPPPLDDCLYALHPRIPHLTRSSLHRFSPCEYNRSRPLTCKSWHQTLRLRSHFP